MGDDDAAGARLWSLAHLGTPMAVRVAATLRIADHVADGVRTAPELAKVVGADPDALERLLRYLAARGVFARDAEGGYDLTPTSEPLRDGHPAGMRAMLDVHSAVGRAELCFVHLLHSIETGEPAYPLMFGSSFWTDMAADPERSASFDARMAADTWERAPHVAAGFDWGRLGHVVDVGGGNGTQLVELLAAHPALRGTLVDQPQAAEAARATLAAAGFADRGTVVAGDFFAPLPAGAGGYLLSLIIHDWDDDAARRILRRCAEAAGPGGSVFVVENLGPDGESPHTGMDLRMLAYYGGKERGLAELTELAAGAGLRAVAVHPAGTASILQLAVTANADVDGPASEEMRRPGSPRHDRV